MAILEKNILFSPSLARNVADLLSRIVAARYKNMTAAACLYPLFAEEAELERAADAACELQESAEALRGVMQAFLAARRAQDAAVNTEAAAGVDL